MICRRFTSFLAFIIIYCYSQLAYSTLTSVGEPIPIKTELRVNISHPGILTRRGRWTYYRKVFAPYPTFTLIAPLFDRLMVNTDKKLGIIDIDNTANGDESTIDTITIGYGYDKRRDINEKYSMYYYYKHPKTFSLLPHHIDNTLIVGNYHYDDKTASTKANYAPLKPNSISPNLMYNAYKRIIKSCKGDDKIFFSVNRCINVYAPTSMYKYNTNRICIGYTFPPNRSRAKDFNNQFDTNFPAKDEGYNIDNCDNFVDCIRMHVTHSFDQIKNDRPDGASLRGAHGIADYVCYSAVSFACGRFSKLFNRSAIVAYRSGNALNDDKVIAAALNIGAECTLLDQFVNVKNAYIGVKRSDSKPLTDNDIAVICYAECNDGSNVINYGLIEGCIYMYSPNDDISFTIINHGRIKSKKIKLPITKKSHAYVMNETGGRIETKDFIAYRCINNGYVKLENWSLGDVFTNNATLEISKDTNGEFPPLAYREAGGVGTLIQDNLYLKGDIIPNFNKLVYKIISKNFYIAHNKFKDNGKLRSDIVLDRNIITDNIYYKSESSLRKPKNYFCNYGTTTINKKIAVSFHNYGDLYLGDDIIANIDTLENKKNIYVDGTLKIYESYFKNYPDSLLVANNIEVMETKFINQGCLKANILSSDSSNILENNGQLYSSYSDNVLIKNTETFYIDSKQAAQASNSRQQNKSEYFNNIENDSGKMRLILTDLQAPTKITYPLLKCNMLFCKNHSKIILEQSASCYHSMTLKNNILHPKKITLVTADNITGQDITDSKFRDNYLFYIKDVTNKRFILNVYNLSFATNGNKQEVSAILEWNLVAKNSSFPKLDTDNCYNIHDIGIYFGVGIEGFYIIEQDKQNLFYMKQKLVVIGKTKKHSPTKMIAIDSSKSKSNDPAIIVDVSKAVTIKQISIEATIDATIDIHTNSPVDNIAVKFRPDKKITDDIIVGSLSYHTLVPTLELKGGVVNNALIQGKYGINIALPFHGKLTNNSKIIGKDVAIKIEGPANIILGSIGNYGLIKSDNYAIHMDSQASNYDAFKEYMQTKHQDKVLPITNSGTIDGNMLTSGNIYLNNKSLIISATSIEHIYGTFNLKNAVSGNINIQAITSAANSKIIFRNSGSFNGDSIQINELHNKNSGSIKTNNLSLDTSFDNEGSITANDVQLNEMTVKNSNGARLIVNTLSQQACIIDNNNNSYLDIGTITTVTKGTNKKSNYQNKNNSILKINNPFTTPLLSIDNKNACLDIKSSSNFNKYESTSGILKVLIPDDPNEITNTPLIKIDGEALFTSNSANSSRFALYAKNPVVLEYEVTITLLEANNITGNDIKKQSGNINNFLAGVDLNPGTKTSAKIIMMSNPVLNTSITPNVLQVQIRWWEIKGGFPKIDNFNTYNMTDALLSYLPFIDGLKVIEYDNKENWYIGKREVHLGKKFANDSAKHIYAPENPANKQAVTIEVDQPLSIRKIIVQGTIDASNYITAANKENYTIGRAGLLITGKELSVTEGIYIEAKNSLISSSSSILNPSVAHKTAALLLENSITANTYNYGEISGLTGISIMGNANLLNGTIINYNKINVLGNLIYSLPIKQQANNQRKFTFCNEQSGTAIAGSGCMLSGNNINIINKNFLQMTTLTHNYASSTLTNYKNAVFNLKASQYVNSTVTMINYGLIRASETLNFTSLQNMTNSSLVADILNLTENSSNDGTININKLKHNKIFGNHSIKAMLIITGTEGLHLKDSNFVNKGDIKVDNSIYLDGKFTNQGNIYTESIVDNKNNLINKKFIRVTGKNGLLLTSNIDNRGKFTVDSTLSVMVKYNSKGDWLVGGFETKAQFTNNTGYHLKVATNDLVINTPHDIINQGVLEVVKSMKLASNFANDGILIAGTLEGVIANIPELNNNGKKYASIDTIKDIIVNNYASLTVNNAIKGNVTVYTNPTLLGNIVTQSGELNASGIYSEGMLTIQGQARITNNLIANFLEVASITAMPRKLQVKNLILTDKLINYKSIETESIKLPRKTEQYGQLLITGASGLYFNNEVYNTGTIKITNGLHIAKEFELTGVMDAKLLTTATDCKCILAKQATVSLANIGDINTSNQIIKIINKGTLNLLNYLGYVKLLGDIAVHKDTDYNNDGEILIHSNVQQQPFSSLRVGKISASKDVNYVLQQNATAQFTELIEQSNISLINNGNFDLQPNSRFKKHRYHNSGTITVNVTDFINSSTETSLLTLDDLILNQQKNNNNFILQPVLNDTILDTTYINQPQTLYLLHITNNIFYLDSNNQKNIIDRIRNDINKYINLTSSSIHGMSFSIDSQIKSVTASSSQVLQSGARYLYVTIASTLTYNFTDKNMGFNQQTLQVAELGKHCIQQISNLWGVCWRYNKSSTAVYDNNLIISPYYAFTEDKLVSYNNNNNNLVIGTTNHKTVYATTANFPAFIIGSKIKDAPSPLVKQLVINNINFSNIQITGRNIIYPRLDVTNRDGLLIAGNNSIKILNKVNIDNNTRFISGYNKHAFHIANGIIGSMDNYGIIGDSSSGYGIYISSAVSLTIANYNTIEGMLAALMLEPAPYWRHQKSSLIINNNKKIIGNILILDATQQANTTINNMDTINAYKLIGYRGLNINNNNTGMMTVNEMSASNIINKGKLKINTDNEFVVNKITNTGDLYIKNIVLANDYTCSGVLRTTFFDGKGYKLHNSGINKLANIKDVTIDKYQILEIQGRISGDVSILDDLTLESNVNTTNDTNLTLSGIINYNYHYITNYGSVTIKTPKFIISKYFINEINANLNIENMLQTQGSLTISGNVHAKYLQPITAGSITIGKSSILTVSIIDNSHGQPVLNFYLQGTLDISRQTSFAVISGDVNIASGNKESSLLLKGTLQQIKGALTIDSIKNLNNAILDVMDTKFTKKINNDKLTIENNNKVQIVSNSSIGSYKPAVNSQLIIPIKDYFNLIDYPLLHITNNCYLNKASKIKIIPDDVFILPIQRRTRIKIISSDNILLATNNTQLQLHDVKNIFSQLSVKHRLIKVIKDSISIEDNGHSLVADIELIDNSSLPSGMKEVEIPLHEEFLGKCQQQDTNITGVSLSSLASSQNYIAIAPYFLAIYSKKIKFANNQLTVGNVANNNTIKVEDYRSPALIVSIQSDPSNIAMNTPISIDSIDIINQDINGYQFAYKSTLGEKANQDGLLITRNNNTIQVNTKINIDKDSIISAGEKNHALHIAIPITGEIENNGKIGFPNTGVGVHFNQLMDGTLTNNNIIQGRLAAINIELDSVTNNKMSIVNNSNITGNIFVSSKANVAKKTFVNIHNKKDAYILASTIKYDNLSELNLINNKGSVVRVDNLSIVNGNNDGIINIFGTALQYKNFNNKAKLYLTDLSIDISNQFINDGLVVSTGIITLNKNYSCNGSITGNILLGNNYQLTLPYASFKTLNNIKIKADNISVSKFIKNDVIIEDTLTIYNNVNQIGNLTAKDITGVETFVINGSTSVANKLTLNTLRVANSANLTVDTIECKRLLTNSGLILVNNLKNTKAEILQQGILKILGYNTVILNSNFHQYGTTEITKAKAKVTDYIVVNGHLVLKTLLADYKPTNKFVKVDINKNSIISIKENIGDINKLDKKIIFVNDGSLILSNKSSINGNIEVHKIYYNPEIPETGIVQLEGNITQQGKLYLGGFLSNHQSEITIQPKSIIKCNSAMQQNTISIVNNGTLEIAQESSLNNYKSKQNSCLVLVLNDIKKLKSASNPALKLNHQAVFNTNSIIKLKPKTRVIPLFSNHRVYLINTTKGIVDASGHKISNIHSLVTSIDTESTLLKITNVALINNNKSLVANVQVNRIYPHADMKSVDMKLLHSLLGSCQPKDELIEVACWNYNKNKTNNMLIYPDLLALDEVAVYDADNSEFIVDSKNKHQYRTIYADKKPAICIGTTISNNTLVSNADDNIKLAKIKFNNLNINAAIINPLLTAATKTSNEDGIIITGANSIVLYDEMLISDTVKIEAGIDRHALHLAAPIVGTINNHGIIGSKTSGYGLAITQILHGEFNNLNSITGDKAAIIIKPMTSYDGKALSIINKGTITGSIIVEATSNINYPNITLKNSANIEGRDVITDNKLDFNIINTIGGIINTNNLRAQRITNQGKINTFAFDVYYMSNHGEITITNSMNLYGNITNNGSINANIIDGKGYQLTGVNSKLTASTLKSIKIYNDLPVNLQERITANVYIKNKLYIDNKYNAVIDASATLQVGSIKIDGQLANNGKLIVFSNDLECSGTLFNKKQALIDTKEYNIVLAATLTNNGSITTHNILGASCTVINNTGAILDLQNLGSNKQNITINNHGIINLNKQLKVPENEYGIIDGNIYINKADKQHNGELNIYTNIHQQRKSNLYLGAINCVNKAKFYIAEHANTVISNSINQHKLSIENKGSVTLQPLSTINKYSGNSISTLILPISNYLSSYGNNYLLTIEDDCVFYPGAKLLLKLSELLQNSLLLQHTRINLLKIKKSIIYNESTITQEEVKNIIDFNHLKLIINLDKSGIRIYKDNKDYTLVSIDITAIGELPHGFGSGNIFLEKSILGECQPKDEKISCFFHKDNLDNHGLPTACNLGIYPSFLVINPVIITINKGNVQIGSPTSHNRAHLEEYNGNHPALVLSTQIDAVDIAADNDTLEFNSLNISNIYITGHHSKKSASNLHPQDGLLITGENPLKVNKGIQIATDTSILAGKNKHALHLAAPIVANITNFGVIGDSINDSGIKISNSLQGEIINLGNISASNTAINIDIDASYLVNMRNMLLTNKKQIKGSIIATVKNSVLTQSIISSTSLIAINHATITLKNYAQIKSCNKLIDNDLLSIKLINQGGNILAKNIAVKLIDNYGIIQKVSALELANNRFINNNKAKLKLVSGSSITINNNNFINNGEVKAFNISLSNNFNNNGLIYIANILNGNDYKFDTSIHSSLECNTLKDIHLTGNTERVAVKSVLLGKIRVDDVLLLRKSIGQSGNFIAREVIVDSTYKDNLFVIDGTVKAINCKLMHLNNELSGTLQTNNLITRNTSNNSGVINTSYLFIYDKFTNDGTINIANNMEYTPNITNKGYIRSEENISISSHCANNGTLIAKMIKSATISNLLNKGIIKIKNLGDSYSDITIVNKGDIVLSKNAMIQGNITITNTEVTTKGDLYIKNSACTLKGLAVATPSTVNISDKSCLSLTTNLDQEKISIINNATLELSTYNKINNYDGRNANLILTIDQELNSIVLPIISCKQHAIFNSDSKISLKPSIVLNHISDNTITLVEAAKGIKFDITKNASLPKLIDLSTKNLPNLVIDSIVNNSLFFKIYNPQVIDVNKKLICQIKLLYDLKNISKNMMYNSILLDKNLIGSCLNKTTSIFAISWTCNKTGKKINSNNLAISPLSLVLNENVISYDCQDKILIFSGTTEDTSIKKITATNSIATAIISSSVETNNKIIDLPKTKILELNGIQVDNLEIIGVNNIHENNKATDGMLITGSHPLKLIKDSKFHIGNKAVIKATENKHALHIAVKFIGDINNYGAIGDKKSGNAIYISQPILTTITNYNAISSPNIALEVCATNDWVLNDEHLTLINNGNIQGSLLFTTASTKTKTKYVTNVYNNKTINSNNIIANNSMILNIHNNGLIDANTIKINLLNNNGIIGVIGKKGITINSNSTNNKVININNKFINASYCNLNNNILINNKSASMTCKHLANATIENNGSLLVTSKLSDNVSISNTLTLGNSIEQFGVLTADNIATNETKLKMSGDIKVASDIKLQQLEVLSTGKLYSNKGLDIKSSSINKGIIDVSYFQAKGLFANNETGKLNIREGSLIVDDNILKSLGSVNVKKLILSGTLTNYGKITAGDVLGKNNILFAITNSQLHANKLTDVTISGNVDIQVAKMIAGRVNINHQLSLSGNVTNIGELKVAILNTNNYKFTIVSSGSVTVSSPLGLTIDDNNFANYGNLQILHNLKLQSTFTNNGTITAYLLDSDKHKFINNKNSVYSIIKNSVLINNGSVTVNHCILGENLIDGKLNIGTKVLQNGSLTLGSIAADKKSELIIDNHSNVNISSLNNNNLNITNFGNLVVNGSMVVNSYIAQGGILTIQVEPKLTGAPFLQAKQNIQINSSLGNQALITISATKGISNFKRNKVIIATAKSLLVDNKKMLDTDLSYLLSVKKITSTSLLLNITNVGIDKNENREAIYADLEYINITDVKQLKTSPVSIRRFASYLQKAKILQLEPYILELIRDEIKHYRLHPDAENEVLYFLQEYHPRAYESLIAKIRNRLLNSIDSTKQSDDYQQVINVINSYLHKHYQQPVAENQAINLTTTAKKHVVDGSIVNNTLYISDKVIQNESIMLDNIVAETESEFYITNNAKVKINNFNNTKISLVNSGLLKVTNNLVVNSYTSWGGCLAINVENINKQPIILVNNNVNLNDSYDNKSQLVLTTSKFNKVGTAISDVLMLQAKKITLNNELLQDTDLANILAMQPTGSMLLRLSNPKQIISNNSHKIIVDLSWIDVKNLLLTANQPISLSQLAEKLQQVTDNEQTNIIDKSNKNKFKISNDLLITGTLNANQLIADKPVLFTINNHALAYINNIDNTNINIVNNGTLNTIPGINVCSYITNGGNLIFKISNVIDKPFLQALNNIEFNINNNNSPTITLQCAALTITEGTQQITLAKAKKILLDGEELLEADINNLIKYQKVASSSILCKLDNTSLTKNATYEVIQAQLSMVDITTIKAIDDKPISVKQLAQLMQKSTLNNTNNTVLNFIEKQITTGKMHQDMHNIYQKFTSRTTDNNQQLNKIINDIDTLHKNNNNNLSSYLNELLPDNSCANLQSIFSISKQAVLSVNNHNAIQANFNFMANKYFSLSTTSAHTMPLWFSVKQQQYRTNNANNYFNAVTNSEVYSMGLEKNYNKLNIGYLLNYGVATTANLNLNNYNKSIDNRVTSVVSAIYTNYNVKHITSYAGFLVAKNKHCYTNTNKLLNDNYNSNYNTITTAVFYNLTTSGKLNNLAFRFNSGVYFMNVNFPEYNVTSIETHSSYSRKLISLYTAITFIYNINLFKNKLTQVNLSLNYSHDFNMNNSNNINIKLLDHNFIISQKKINYQELNLDAAININLTKNSNMIFNVNDSLSSNGNKFNVKIQYNYKI